VQQPVEAGGAAGRARESRWAQEGAVELAVAPGTPARPGAALLGRVEHDNAPVRLREVGRNGRQALAQLGEKTLRGVELSALPTIVSALCGVRKT